MPGPPACSLSVLTSAVASPLPCFRLQCNRGRPRSSWISLLPPLSAGLLSLRSDICCGISAALLQASTQRRQTSQQPASIAPAASACLPTLTLCHLSPTLTLCHLLPTLTLCHLSRLCCPASGFNATEADLAAAGFHHCCQLTHAAPSAAAASACLPAHSLCALCSCCPFATLLQASTQPRQTSQQPAATERPSNPTLRA